MLEFMLGGLLVLVFLFAVIQLALLLAGQNAVETASHFAARKFALNARDDYRKAKEAALAEAFIHCLRRPGGRWSQASLTTLDFSRGGATLSASRADSGDAFRVRLTHGVELVVPWISRILYEVAPVRKTKVGNRFYFLLQATRWVTVE